LRRSPTAINPDDLYASVTSASSPTGIARHSSPCALSYWQRQQFCRDPLSSLRLCAPCGCVRNAAAPWSYWNGSPRSSCDSVPLRHPLPGSHEQIFLNSNFSHPPRWSSDVCPFADSPTVTHTNSRMPHPMLHSFPASTRAGNVLLLPAHPARRHSKPITGRGPNGLPSNGSIESDPAGTFPFLPEFARRVPSDTLAFV
jgi:hypothetical protein